MAESITKDFKGKLDWVYVGKAEAPKHVEKKPDTVLNEYMQTVLDVAKPVAKAEMADVTAVQEKMIEEVMRLTGATGAKQKEQFVKKWMEMEKKYSTEDHQNRMGKILTSVAYMAGSFGLNFTSEWLAKAALDNRDKLLVLNLLPKTGNKRMLEAGWQYLTDYGIEKAADKSAQWLTNREDVGFISPLSRTIGKIGNSLMTVTKLLERHDWPAIFVKSALNPGFIEGTIRLACTVPKSGFIKEWYGKANRQIMKGEGLIPLGADLAFNMMIAKVSGQMEGKIDAKNTTGTSVYSKKLRLGYRTRKG